MSFLAGVGGKADDQAAQQGRAKGEQPLLLGQAWHHLAATPLQAALHRREGINDGSIFAVFAHVVLVAVAGLQFDPESARHQGEEGIANVEVEQVAAAGVGHQHQAAFIQAPELLHRQTWGAVVLTQHPQLPATAGFKGVEGGLQAGPLAIAEGLGQVDHWRGVVRQQVGVVIGLGGAGAKPQQADQEQQGCGEATQAPERLAKAHGCCFSGTAFSPTPRRCRECFS